MTVINTSIGICAHNEERNIGKLLDALLNQNTQFVRIIQICVVSCSTDRTNEIVQRYGSKDSRIELIVQKKRLGKAAAINLFLKKVVGDVIVLQSADTLPEKSTIEKLVSPLLNKNVGMTGGRPIPTNNRKKLMGFVSHLLWKLHHEISVTDINHPKCGELVAFRNVISGIPEETSVDEAWIELAIRKKSLSLRYAQDAKVYNHGPETVSDFLKQRRRILYGHLHLKEMGYEVSTMNVSKILNVLPNVINPDLREFFLFSCAVFLEGYGRLLGMYDFYITKKNPYVWDIATSTKTVGI